MMVCIFFLSILNSFWEKKINFEALSWAVITDSLVFKCMSYKKTYISKLISGSVRIFSTLKLRYVVCE